MEAYEGDGNAGRLEVVKWNNVSPVVQVKFLFLLDTGDVTSLDSSAAKEARNAFLSVLQDSHHSFSSVTKVLRNRTKKMQEYTVIEFPKGTMAADLSVRKDEDLLTFVHACHQLNIEYHHLEDKIKKVQEKLNLTKDEMEGNEFIYTENLRMVRLCGSLTISQVEQLLALIVKDEALEKCVEAGLDGLHVELGNTEGLKEALFFYLIREMELHSKLNRTYTYHLKVLLKQMQHFKGASQAEKHVLPKAISDLNDYPSGGRPAGYCLVFCVTKKREGAEEEIKKVKDVFKNILGYTVHIEKDPEEETLENCFAELQKPKYKFYDSIVYWVMCHGNETDLQLADDSVIKRKAFIHHFSKVNNFRKKPKIFFMAACQGNKIISTEKKKGVLVSRDGIDEGKSPFSVMSEGYNTAIYNQMDLLVANATLHQFAAFRDENWGSVYVDTVCSLMEQHRGHSITQVLELVANRMHQILFREKNSFVKIKQACYYESTLNKTFRIPAQHVGDSCLQTAVQETDDAFHYL